MNPKPEGNDDLAKTAPLWRVVEAWIDPRCGKETPIAAGLRPQPDGAWPVPAKPAGDWLLRVKTT